MLDLSVTTMWEGEGSILDKVLSGGAKVLGLTIPLVQSYYTIETARERRRLEEVQRQRDIEAKIQTEIPLFYWVMGIGIILVLLLRK